MEPTAYSTPKKGAVPVAAMLIGNLKNLSREDLKQILVTVSNEMEVRECPLEAPQSL